MPVRMLFAVALLLAGGAAQASQDVVMPSVPFSAVAVQQANGVQLKQMIHYANGKLRIDGLNGFATTILDLKTETECVLMANRTYLVLPMDNELFRRFFAQPVNDTGAKKLGHEKLSGIETTKYVFDADGALDAGGYYWLTDTGIMVRRAYEEGVFGENRRHLDFLTDLKVGAQDQMLFEIPAGYRRARQ